MDATFVLDRSHSATFPLSPLPFPPLPQTVSVLRVWSGVRGCAPPRRTEPKQPAGRSCLLSPTPSPLFFSSSPALKSKGVGGDNILLLLLLPPLFLQKIAQANSANKKKKQKHLRRKKKKKTRSVSRFSAVHSGERRESAFRGDVNLSGRRHPLPDAFSRHIVTHIPLPQPPVLLQRLLSLLLRFHHQHQLSPPHTPPPCQIRLAAALFWLT